MPASVDREAPYPAQAYSASQLLHAAKATLRGSTSGGRIVTTLNETELDALENDALQVLSLIRSMKNSFALVNGIPPEVLSLIPNHWEDGHGDKNFIQLTHVCRSWRDIFVSCSSLWTHLDFANVDKTRIYIERSKPLPLKISLEVGDTFYQNEAFLLAVPHIPRLKTLSISGNPTHLLPILVEHFSCAVPLLEELTINFGAGQAPSLPDKLFNGGLSSLREFNLASVITSLPWRDLSNLTTFNLRDVPKDKILLNQLLDFFESVPLLRYIHLHDSIPSSHNVPAVRVVSLSHLEVLSVTAQPAHSVLLDHLFIPAGALLRLEFDFRGWEVPTSSHLPEPDRLGNLSHITSVNFCFGSERRFMRLEGPSGELYALGNWIREGESHNVEHARFMRTICQYDISRTQWLAITLSGYQPLSGAQITTWTTHRILRRMENLRALMLVQSKNLPFIHVLNPNMNPSETVLCPKLEEIILYIEYPDQLELGGLLIMVRERDLRGAKLPAVTIVSTEALAPPKEVFRLRKHVSRVEYKFDDAPPEWDTLPSWV